MGKLVTKLNFNIVATFAQSLILLIIEQVNSWIKIYTLIEITLDEIYLVVFQIFISER